MRNIFLTLVLLVSAPTFAADKIKQGDPMPANLFVELAKAVNPGVVNIFTSYLPKGRIQRYGVPGQDPFFDMFEQFMGPNPYRSRPQQALGSGFIIREDGLIITNNHVIDKADVIKVQIDEKTKASIEAKVIGTDPQTDIALIKINPKDKKLTTLKLGVSANLQVGEWVAAFGNPYGHGHSMTKGIISAIGREIDENNLNSFIQTDASINPGNSGGPLVNTAGEVIGVNTAIDARAQGIGFAIPIDSVKAIISQLEKTGTIQRGYIGVILGDVSEEDADQLEMPESRGAMVMDVIPDSPAAKAGIQTYDLIVSIDNIKVTSTAELRKAVKTTPVNKKVVVSLVRNGKPRSVSLVIEPTPEMNPQAMQRQPRRKESAGSQKAPFDLGFSVANFTPQVAREFNLPQSRQGGHPIITDVLSGSEAEIAGLSPGDMILDVNRKRVDKAPDVFRELKRGRMNLLRVLKRDRVVLISLRVP